MACGWSGLRSVMGKVGPTHRFQQDQLEGEVGCGSMRQEGEHCRQSTWLSRDLGLGQV